MSVTEVDVDDLEDDKREAQSAAKEHGIDYPTLLDGDAKWMKSAGIEGIPTFLVIDRDGRLAYRYRGGVRPGSDAYRELEKAIERALDAG